MKKDISPGLSFASLLHGRLPLACTGASDGYRTNGWKEGDSALVLLPWLGVNWAMKGAMNGTKFGSAHCRAQGPWLTQTCFFLSDICWAMHCIKITHIGRIKQCKSMVFFFSSGICPQGWAALGWIGLCNVMTAQNTGTLSRFPWVKRLGAKSTDFW